MAKALAIKDFPEYYIKNGKIIAKFYGASEAERITGVLRTAILNCCHGWSKTAGGYQWKQKEI